VNPLSHLVEDFSEQNLLLQMLLGILAGTERIARLLPAPAARGGRLAADRAIDPFLAALLGIVSIRLQVQQAVRETARPRVSTRRSRPRRRSPNLRELMR
jgi:hypothetical protein